MSCKRTKRILKEFQELEDSRKILEESGIYFEIREEDINFLYFMIVGQKNTPYENGFYFFIFEYPSNYPMSPPIGKYMTHGTLKTYKNTDLKIRFNPNLYTNGKVCLSMLNTWSGPGWVPTNTITSVVVAIQALVLTENPLMNEPGFENASEERLEKYNQVIQYANIKISIMDMIHRPPHDFTYFIPIMKQYFMEHKEEIQQSIQKCKERERENEEIVMDAGVYDLKNIVEDYEYMEDYFQTTLQEIELENKCTV
jgi:ubiquitin-conjugating enzyme E2 Z